MPPAPDRPLAYTEARLAAPETVKSLIADRWLASREIAPRLGDITLAPHQRDAAARLLDLLEEHAGAVLADEAGMGKTFTALAVARAFPRFRVVAPAALRHTWRHAMEQARVPGDFHSFEALSRSPALPDEPLSLVIVDEAHHARNPHAKRYRALARLTWGARVLLLTATPVHNRLRDLRSQLALFLGSGAESLGTDALARLVVRRGHDATAATTRLPAVEPVKWLRTDLNPDVLRAIMQLPPPVPPADGGEAHALLRLGLVRAWASSAAALRAALRHRLHQAAALGAALEAGRFPTRRELSAWSAVGDALQLAFPELVSDRATRDAPALHAAITAHTEGVRCIVETLAQVKDPDVERARNLRRIRASHPGERVVAFTHFAETAQMLYRRLAADGAVALVTARCARIASGPVPRAEILARLAPTTHADDRRIPLSLLIATDVLSEGLNLQQASVLVHLDLPWTAARLEQRLGRIRRMGSPHERVFTYAIGPPAGARELRTMLRALQRKLRLVRSLVRPPELPELEALVPSRWPAPGGALDLTSATERLRSSLGRWRAPAPRTGPPPAAPLVAVATLGQPGDAWKALALIAGGTRARLAVLDTKGASEHPNAVLAFLRTEARSHAGDLPSRGVMRTALRAAERWLAEQRGAAAVDPALGAPSPAHAGALRHLENLLARAGRHERQPLAELAMRGRDLVLRSRGAGAEDFLREWLAARSAPAAPADLAALMACLERRDPRRDAGAIRPRLLALYVLAPGEGTAAVPATEPLPQGLRHRYIVAAGPTLPAGTVPACVTTPVSPA